MQMDAVGGRRGSSIAAAGVGPLLADAGTAVAATVIAGGVDGESKSIPQHIVDGIAKAGSKWEKNVEKVMKLKGRLTSERKVLG